MTSADAKRALRARQRAWREALPSEARARAVGAACAHLVAHPAWERARTLAVYAALPGEPDLRMLVDEAWASGRTVALPITPGRGVPLQWRAHRPGIPLARGPFRVPEPPGDAMIVDPATIDLVVVPALAVDPAGYRLGYGGGYYDRSLPQMTRATRAWLGLDAQIVEHVPHEDYDVPVHALVTPSGWRETASARQGRGA